MSLKASAHLLLIAIGSSPAIGAEAAEGTPDAATTARPSLTEQVSEVWNRDRFTGDGQAWRIQLPKHSVRFEPRIGASRGGSPNDGRLEAPLQRRPPVADPQG